MSHYKSKREAIIKIEDMIKKAGVIEIEQIQLAIARVYGFGTKIVRDHIELLRKSGDVEISGTQITYRKAGE